jgi:hypothetical protein
MIAGFPSITTARIDTTSARSNALGCTRPARRLRRSPQPSADPAVGLRPDESLHPQPEAQAQPASIPRSIPKQRLRSCQLRHIPLSREVLPEGFEPATNRLEGGRTPLSRLVSRNPRLFQCTRCVLRRRQCSRPLATRGVPPRPLRVPCAHEWADGHVPIPVRRTSVTAPEPHRGGALAECSPGRLPSSAASSASHRNGASVGDFVGAHH